MAVTAVAKEPAPRTASLTSAVAPSRESLDVDVVAGGQAGGRLLGDPGPVGRELDPDVVLGGVVDQLPEVGADGRLAPADVDVEDLHPLELVDERLALLGG